MHPVLRSEAMRRCDERTSSDYGIPTILLMEHAGRAVAEEVVSLLSGQSSPTVMVVCGKGNNAGDGFVCARHLLDRGIHTLVIKSAEDAEYRGDALTNLNILRRRESLEYISILQTPDTFQQIIANQKVHCFVDAIFGTGFRGTVSGQLAEWIAIINQSGIPIVAVDIASGIDADTGKAAGPVVSAVRTVALATKKPGHLLDSGRVRSGSVHVVDIGIPKKLLIETDPEISEVDARDISAVLPRRNPKAHKYSAGKALLIAGSRAFPGSVMLAVAAAYRSGAGAVVAAVPSGIAQIIQRKIPEAIVLRLPETEEGTISISALEALRRRIEWADAVLLGPGLSRHTETDELVRTIIKEVERPVVLDADGINAIDPSSSIVSGSSNQSLVLTPHVGEISRLTGRTVQELESDRLTHGRSIANELGKILVSKGAPTITFLPDGRSLINSSGSATLATAGSGDVLSGILVSLMAQGMNADAAAWAGVFIHGRCADQREQRISTRGIMASDLIKELPAVFAALLNMVQPVSIGVK